MAKVELTQARCSRPRLPRRARRHTRGPAADRERVMTPSAVALLVGDTEPAQEPALKIPVSADLSLLKPLKKPRSFSSQTGTQKPVAKMKPNPADALLIIGFDAEWVTEAPDLPDDDGKEDDRPVPEQIPRNRILSYQYACR